MVVRVIDEVMMDQALELAAKGLGATSPNPMVGAVVTQGERIVGRGFHARAGAAHAEVVALDEAGEAARGGKLYCNLEPCCHTGQTGPCVERILGAGIAGVVVAVEDPDPRANGAGIRRLRDRGIKVIVGVRGKEAARLNEAFFTVNRLSRPFVTMKVAVSLDGRITAKRGRRTPMTGAVADEHAHTVRAEVDAIGVGSETMLVDDPLLTARGRNRHRPLVRVIFDTRMRTSPVARVLTTLVEGPVVIMTTDAALETWPERAVALRRTGAIIESLPARDPAQALSRLVSHEVSHLLLEGGAVLHRAAWVAGVVDRVRLYVSPVVLGRTGVPWMPDGRFSFAALTGRCVRCLGKDVLLEANVQRFD